METTRQRMQSVLGMQSKLVDIGTHSLCLYSNRPFPTAPPSPAADPAVFLLAGLGCSNLGYSALIRQLSPHAHIYAYDRAGYGSSEASPAEPTAETIAAELDALIRRAGITQRLVVVGHSWAGIFAPEYVLRAGSSAHIAGLVLIDSNQERTLDVTDWRDSAIVAVGDGVDYFGALGIRAEHKLTPEEFALVMDEVVQPHHVRITDTEKGTYGASFPVLKQKRIMELDPPLLGDAPLCVIIGRAGRDFQRMYDAGVAMGNGTEEQRRRMRELIATWSEKEEELQRGQLVYSTNGTVLIAEESGHRIELTQPDVITEAVRWCLQEDLRHRG